MPRISWFAAPALWIAASISTPTAAAQESCQPLSITMPEFTAALDARDAGRDSAAISIMESLTVKFSGSPAPYYILGNWFWEDGDIERARAAWKSARTAVPT